MNEGLPRSLLALTVIVAAVVFFFGIKDFIQQKNPNPAAGTSTPTVVDSNTGAVQKKTTSLKASRARISVTKADVRTAAQAADDTEKPLIRKDSPNSGAKEVVANNNAPNAVTAANDDQETGMEPNNNGVRNDTIKDSEIFRPTLSTPKCVPLPNVTAQADVDAPYYQNWAREYSCYDLSQAAPAASH